MALSIELPNGEILTGDAALAHLGSRGLVDARNQPIPDTQSGLQALLALLNDRYGADDQYASTAAADAALDLRRGRLSLMDYLTEHDYTLEESRRLGGLQMNAVG